MGKWDRLSFYTVGDNRIPSLNVETKDNPNKMLRNIFMYLLEK